MGVFLYKYNLFATYEDSGLGTFAHEIMHPLVERNLKDRPEWAIEGIPTFFEKFYGYWRGDELIVNWELFKIPGASNSSERIWRGGICR
jgi:hypothetical protein